MTRQELLEKLEIAVMKDNMKTSWKEFVNNFCNENATSYEEYMTIWEMLCDAYGVE